jgi:YfiH family protein
VTVDRPAAHAGEAADALVSACRDAPLAVFTADCAPVALAGADGADGVVGLVHAGWRGLVAGVLERAVDRMRALGATSVVAALGPCIRAGCYEFGPSELDTVAKALGDDVRATTAWGTPALDLPAAVDAALGSVGVPMIVDCGACTACSTAWFSYRARAEDARQATVVWLPGDRGA